MPNNPQSQMQEEAKLKIAKLQAISALPVLIGTIFLTYFMGNLIASSAIANNLDNLCTCVCPEQKEQHVYQNPKGWCDEKCQKEIYDNDIKLGCKMWDIDKFSNIPKCKGRSAEYVDGLLLNHAITESPDDICYELNWGSAGVSGFMGGYNKPSLYEHITRWIYNSDAKPNGLEDKIMAHVLAVLIQCAKQNE